MVQSLKSIKQPIEKELKIFEQRFREDMRSHVALLDKITYYIVQRKGKQVRPMFVFLSARLFDEINDASYHAASLVELLHTATLVHDDVVDDTSQRTSFFSLNPSWKNKIAVIVGDYLLQKGFLIALKNKRFQLLEIVSIAVKEISEGQILEIEKNRKLDLDEKTYFEIIRLKTASLISAACAVGAASTSSSSDNVKKMQMFGEKIGIAFQIRDDLFDLGMNGKGKPLGIDLQERSINLPFVHALQNANFEEKQRITQLIRANKNPKEVFTFIKEKGSLEYAHNVMNQYRDDAIEVLKTIPSSNARTSLEELVDYVLDRKK